MKIALSQKFHIKDLGELHYFFGVQVIQDTKNSSAWWDNLRSQNLFLTNMYGMKDAESNLVRLQ